MFKHFDLNYDPIEHKIWYSSCEREALSWKLEIENSAKIIADRASESKKDIWLCLSGGVDSEIIAETFKNLDISFKVLIFRFNNEINAHDIFWAHRWVEENNISYKIYDFDIIDFLRVGYQDYLKMNLVSNNAFRYLEIEMMKVIEELNGYAVFGGKSVGLGLHQCTLDSINQRSDAEVFDRYDVGSLAPLEWIRKNNLGHCVFFYQTTNEIHKAYLSDPLHQFLISNPYYLRCIGSNESAKTLLIRAHFPHIANRQKYHGFEKIYELREICQIEMAKYFNLDSNISNKRFKKVFYNNMIYIDINEVLRQLG